MKMLQNTALYRASEVPLSWVSVLLGTPKSFLGTVSTEYFQGSSGTAILGSTQAG